MIRYSIYIFKAFSSLYSSLGWRIISGRIFRRYLLESSNHRNRCWDSLGLDTTERFLWNCIVSDVFRHTFITSLYNITQYGYILRFLAVNAGILYVYFSNFQKIDEEEYGGSWELTKEGFMSSFAGFLVRILAIYRFYFSRSMFNWSCFQVMWIIVYTGVHHTWHIANRHCVTVWKNPLWAIISITEVRANGTNVFWRAVSHQTSNQIRIWFCIDFYDVFVDQL